MVAKVLDYITGMCVGIVAARFMQWGDVGSGLFIGIAVVALVVSTALQVFNASTPADSCAAASPKDSEG